MRAGRNYITFSVINGMFTKGLSLVLLLLIPLFANANKHQTLAGTVFQSFDIRFIQLKFFDDKHCEFRQHFNVPLPHDNYEIIDTLHYHVLGSKIYLGKWGRPITREITIEQIQDSLSLGGMFDDDIYRDGVALKQYTMAKDMLPASPRMFYSAGWIRWDKKVVATMEFYDILTIPYVEQALYLVEGEHQVKHEHYFKNIEYSCMECKYMGRPFPCDDASYKIDRRYKWFTRERSLLPTDSTIAGVVHNRFRYQWETLDFKTDTTCTWRHNAYNYQRTYRYSIDGPYVLIYGMDGNMPEKADSLVYGNKVLYHTCITQRSDHIDYTNVKTLIGPQYHAIVSHPTAKMQTRAFVLEGEVVTDEQVGTTFLKTYTPINFHSFTPLFP